MNQDITRIGFIGSGGIARSHAYSLNSLKYFYNDAPALSMEAVCSATEASRDTFSRRFGFLKSCDIQSFISNNSIDTVFILGPNKVHFEHFKAAINMPGIKRIYLEKPVCSNAVEENEMAELAKKHPGVKVQVGFQFLFSSSIRSMLHFWKSGILGKPVHFELKYYHSDYLKKEYRDKRQTRLTAAPDGGAMADLGSHSISLLIALLGTEIRIMSALQGGTFDDVRADSDLFSLISLWDAANGAVGTIAASRISSGTGDYFSLELYADKGALRYSSASPDQFEYFTEESAVWTRKVAGSNFQPVTSFPSGHVPPGWLRSMIHAHYVFLTGNDHNESLPDLSHGLAVQRLVTDTAAHLKEFRMQIGRE
jgi:predicted dehydrogenase